MIMLTTLMVVRMILLCHDDDVVVYVEGEGKADSNDSWNDAGNDDSICTLTMMVIRMRVAIDLLVL